MSEFDHSSCAECLRLARAAMRHTCGKCRSAQNAPHAVRSCATYRELVLAERRHARTHEAEPEAQEVTG